MSTYKELIYLILDELKMTSDDSHFRLEHILFLLDKYRSLLLKQRYDDVKKDIPDSNFQTICLDMSVVQSFSGDSCSNRYLRSKQTLPMLIPIGYPRLTSVDFFSNDFNIVSNERFIYAGSNKYIKNIIYSSIAPDNYLYMKSRNPQAYSIEKVKLTGIFENSEAASDLVCDNIQCDILDREFPMEESLLSTLVELIVKELSGYKYQMKDTFNNANDDLSNMITQAPKDAK